MSPSGIRGRPPKVSRALPNILKRIGSTPLIELKKLPNSKGARVFAKIEQLNPGGSVKDRIALNMILDAEGRGLIAKRFYDNRTYKWKYWDWIGDGWCCVRV